jgi:hypothetical protein
MEGFYRLGSTLDEGHGFSRAINAALMRALQAAEKPGVS